MNHGEYTPKKLEVLDGAYDRVLFFKNILRNQYLYDVAVMSFWQYWINNVHLLETHVEDPTKYKEELIGKYAIVGDVLKKVNKLEGDETEYDEDFAKFINLGVPIDYVYKKVRHVPNDVQIDVNEDRLKIFYQINYNKTGIEIVRLFLENGISNWTGKTGVEIAIQSSLPDKDITLKIIDENNLEWCYNLETKGTRVTTKIIPFSEFRLNETQEQVNEATMALDRVKSLALTWDTDKEKEEGYIEINNIKVY